MMHYLSNCSKTTVTLFHICRHDSTDSCHALTDMWEKQDDDVTGQLTNYPRR